MNNELQRILDEAKKNIGQYLSPAQKGSYDMNDMYVLVKDLAHTGGVNTSPISIMRNGTIFYKMKGSGYYSDGFHLVLGKTCKHCTDYFQKLVVS